MKEIIYDFSKEKATNAQHVQFAKDTLAVIPEEVATEHGFTPQRADYATDVTAEQAGFKPEKSYKDTKKVEAADKWREKVYMFYKQIAKAYADYCPDATKSASGESIMFVFDEAGDVLHADYAAETALMDDVAEKLGQEPYTSALADIGIDNAATDIAEANAAFNAVYQQRSTVERDRAFAATLKTLRQKTDNSFETLAKAINALYAANALVAKDEDTEEALGGVIDAVNAVVVRFRKTISGSVPTAPDEGGDDSDLPVTEPDEPTEPGGDDENLPPVQ